MLVDSGASHNFIHHSALKTSKHTITSIKPLRVRVASGVVMLTKERVRLEITLQKFTFTTDYYVLHVSGCEVILKAVWLKPLGDILWNFETKIMKFGYQGRRY